MAICEVCKREMLERKGCVSDILVFTPKNGPPLRYPKIPCGNERRASFAGPETTTCHDCGVPVGAWHHPGCDWEECPRCHGQLISCVCNDQGTFADEIPRT